MTQLVYASTLYAVATVAAAVKAGRLGDGERRVLVVSHNAAVPELTEPFSRSPAFAALAGRFDDVVSLDEVLAPLHPSGWSPRSADAFVIGRLLADRWGLGGGPGGGPARLVLESVAVNPARALAALFPDAPVTVYAEGLMSYGPTRSRLPAELGDRVEELLHLDLVPGLRPLLLRELDVPARTIATDAFTDALDEVAAALEVALDPGPDRPALVVGQYLAALGVLSPQEEHELHVRMLRGVARLGHDRVLLKPHPAAPAPGTDRLAAEAADLGLRLEVVDPALPAEVVVARRRPDLVVGCFSTALITASRLYGVPAARVGTELVLERLRPYQNSNRVPLVLVDALVPGLDGEPPAPQPVQQVLDAVGYCMQPQALPGLRDVAAGLLEAAVATGGRLDPRVARWFRGRRLAALALPGAPAARRFSRLLRRLRPARAMLRRTTARRRG